VPVQQELKNRARELRSNQTDVEAKLWRCLRDRQVFGAKFRRQHPIGSYIVDFCCPTLRIIVELDGGQHGEKVDTRRTAYLEAQGYRVMRFWNNEVIDGLEGVLEAILRALDG